jgi:hypothetical protein
MRLSQSGPLPRVIEAATIALANKLARIAWSVLAHRRTFEVSAMV